MSLRLLKSTFTVGVMTTISRVFGLVRDILIARLFGAGLGVDVFIVAFRIPNFLRRLFAEGGFSQAFVISYQGLFLFWNLDERLH